MDFFNITLPEYKHIVEECMLNEEYQKLLELEIKGYTRVKIANELSVSIDTLDKMIAKLKKKIKKIL